MNSSKTYAAIISLVSTGALIDNSVSCTTSSEDFVCTITLYSALAVINKFLELSFNNYPLYEGLSL